MVLEMMDFISQHDPEVGAAVRAIQSQGPFQVEPLEFVMVRQENMYNPENQKLLFPVTR